MRVLLVAVLLGVVGVGSTAAQSARCQLSPRPYGFGGLCRLDPGEPATSKRLRIPFADSVRIWMTSGPRDQGPWRGNISLPRLETSFEIAEERRAPTEGRLVFRTGIAWLLVREWRELDSTAQGCSACERSARVVSLVIDLVANPLATEDDIAILRGALANLDNVARWNRKEEQACNHNEPRATGLFCLLFAAVEARMGRYHHRQPALAIVRLVIMERWRERVTGHTLIDFNNHSATQIDDLRTALELSLARAGADVRPNRQ